MQFRISYDEIQQALYRQSDKHLLFTYSDTHTVRVAAEVNVLFKTTSVGIDITVLQVSGDDLTLSYSGGIGIEMMLKMALGRLQGTPAEGTVELQPGSRVVVHLGRMPQLAPVLEKVELHDIYFDPQYIVIDFHLKGGLPTAI